MASGSKCRYQRQTDSCRTTRRNPQYRGSNDSINKSSNMACWHAIRESLRRNGRASDVSTSAVPVRRSSALLDAQFVARSSKPVQQHSCSRAVLELIHFMATGGSTRCYSLVGEKGLATWTAVCLRSKFSQLGLARERPWVG